MTTAAVPPRRRRPVTYGKWSRKASHIGHGAAHVFAETTRPSHWIAAGDVRLACESNDQQAAKKDTHSREVSNIIPATLASIGLPPLLRENHTVNLDGQSISMKTTSQLPKGIEHFDLLEFDGLSSREPKIYDNGARKKRKLDPLSVHDNLALVYDDESLQRHIAAEAEADTRQTRATEGESQISSQQSLQVDSNIVISKSTESRGKESELITRKRQHVMRDPGVLSAKETIGDPFLAPEPLSSHTRAFGVAEDPALKGHDTNSKSPLNLESCDVQLVQPHKDQQIITTHQRETQGHKTPPSSREHEASITTPRQREMWSRLLVDDAHAGSPSLSPVSGLEIIGGRSKAVHGQVPEKSSNSAKDSATRSERKRIIDTLHVPSLEEGPSTCDSNESFSSFGSLREPCSDAATSNRSIHHVPSPSKPGAIAQPLHDIPGRAAQPVPFCQSAGLKVTYARQRSYLAEANTSQTTIMGSQFSPRSKTFARPAKRDEGARDVGNQHLSSKSPDVLDEVQNSQSGIMRSIHELREAGGNVRIAGELESLFDDLKSHYVQDSSLRSTLIQLATKLEEPSNCRLLVDKGLAVQLSAFARSTQDLFEISLYAIVILQLMANSSLCYLISQSSDLGMVNFLIGLLQLDHDLISCARLREHNMSRLTQKEYSGLCKTIIYSSCWRGQKPPILSCQILSLQSLEHLARWACQAPCTAELIPTNALNDMVTSFVPSPERSSQATGNSVRCLELAIQILESSIINNTSSCQASEVLSLEARRLVVGILPYLKFWANTACPALQEPILRFFLNVTNHNPSICQQFVTPQVISEMFIIIFSHFKLWESPTEVSLQPIRINLVILSLGCLINFAESSDALVRMVQSAGRDSSSNLDRLLGLFKSKSRKIAAVSSEEESLLIVPFGYLSVLLSILCIDKDIRSAVCAQLAGGTLKLLLDALQEFLHYHKQIAGGNQIDDIDDEFGTGFIARLQGVLDALQT